MKKLLLTLVAILLAASPTLSADRNSDGLDDNLDIDLELPDGRDGETIAIVDTGDSAADALMSRLVGLGYAPVFIPVGSNFDTLVGYQLVCLPVSHAGPAYNGTFTALAQDYHDYVGVGGGLWIGQPNPFGMPGNMSDIPWAPYELTVEIPYDGADCPATIVAEHCLTLGLTNDDVPFPGDNAIAYGPEWEVIVRGPATGRPAVLFAAFGQGNCLVEFGHPNPAAICSPSDACLDNFVQCTLGLPVNGESTSWGDVKGLYR